VASHNLIKEENKHGHVTVQIPVYVGNHLFKVNNQYVFTKIQWFSVGCGCGGKKKETKKFYLLTVNDRGKEHKYSVEAKHLVETEVAIPKVSQNFDVARRDQHRNPGTDFSAIVDHPDPDAILKHANNQARDTWRHNDWSY